MAFNTYLIDRLTVTIVLADRVYFGSSVIQHYSAIYKRYSNITNYFTTTKKTIKASGNPGIIWSNYDLNYKLK